MDPLQIILYLYVKICSTFQHQYISAQCIQKHQKPWLNFINYISTEYSRLSLVSEVPFPSSLLLHMCCRYN